MRRSPDQAGAAMENPQCPLCARHFSRELIEAHASRCKGGGEAAARAAAKAAPLKDGQTRLDPWAHQYRRDVGAPGYVGSAGAAQRENVSAGVATGRIGDDSDEDEDDDGDLELLDALETLEAGNACAAEGPAASSGPYRGAAAQPAMSPATNRARGAQALGTPVREIPTALSLTSPQLARTAAAAAGRAAAPHDSVRPV